MVEKVRTRQTLELLHPWANLRVHLFCNALPREAFLTCRIEQLHLANHIIEVAPAADMAFADRSVVANPAFLAPPLLTQLRLEHIILENMGCCFNVVLPRLQGR